MKAIPKEYSYVLLTAARNEEAYIEKTIQSVISQTFLPKKWIIVSDGSTDHTNEIVNEYAKRYKWIELFRRSEHHRHNYAAKAYCVNFGYKLLKDVHYDLVGNLDADISFDKDFFEFLIEKFLQIPTLGVAGTRYVENNHVAIYSFKDVAGQCQLFRRECFDEIGGYLPSKYGGIDNIAVLTSRMKGWKTLTFSEKTFFHHRAMSTAARNKWTSKVKHGREDYLLGNHPLWQFFRIIYQSTQKPYLIGSILLFYGYASSFLIRLKRPISEELLNFQRIQQKHRLKIIFQNILKFKLKIEET